MTTRCQKIGKNTNKFWEPIFQGDQLSWGPFVHGDQMSRDCLFLGTSQIKYRAGSTRLISRIDFWWIFFGLIRAVRALLHKCILTKLAYICFLASSFDFTQLVGPQFLSKKREKRSFLNISQRSKLLKLIKNLEEIQNQIAIGKIEKRSKCLEMSRKIKMSRNVSKSLELSQNVSKCLETSRNVSKKTKKIKVIPKTTMWNRGQKLRKERLVVV